MKISNVLSLKKYKQNSKLSLINQIVKIVNLSNTNTKLKLMGI